jgi:hypothetical protein
LSYIIVVKNRKVMAIAIFEMYFIVSIVVIVGSLVQVIRLAIKKEFSNRFWIYLTLFPIFLIIDLLILPVDRVYR